MILKEVLAQCYDEVDNDALAKLVFFRCVRSRILYEQMLGRGLTLASCGSTKSSMTSSRACLVSLQMTPGWTQDGRRCRW
jgi:hypothetical protein